MVDAQCSERCEATHGGSNPPPPTNGKLVTLRYDFSFKGDLNGRRQARNDLAESGSEKILARIYRGRVQSPPAHLI